MLSHDGLYEQLQKKETRKTANTLLQILRDEKEAGISGGFYHELQVRMTYNSNHIEGSRLTEDQTRLIFETNTIDAGDGIPVDDILETVHHFREIDYVIDVAEEELSEEIIKHLHYILKHDTRDAALSWFAVGDYKRRPNMVGGHETAKPKDVPARTRWLACWTCWRFRIHSESVQKNPKFKSFCILVQKLFFLESLCYAVEKGECVI